jgi:putative ABC transport system permease protein
MIMYVDHDFLETLGVSVAEGRDFNPEFPTDASQGFIVNEAAARTLNLPTPMDKSVRMSYGEYGKTIYEKKGKVIGKVDDFLVTNAKMSSGPTFITLADEGEKYYLGYCLMRIRPGKFREVQASITRVWEKIFPNQPMELEYIDQNLAAAYEAESRSGRIFASFSLLAMLIASIGLLGLAVFTTHQRTKEIGIRKILGASAGRIVLLLNKEFTVPVLVAMGIAAPLAYLAMHHWLETYPYAITLKVWPFLVSGLIALAMTWLTVGFLSLKASSINPARALRDE